MSDIFITSDEHYGHNNIITYCKRPFANVSEMKDYIIAQHNKKVPDSPNMLTIHAGDLFWNTLTQKEAADILCQLNGKHAFLYGNHDELIERNSWLREQFEWVKGENKVGGATLVNFQNRKLLVSHFAHRVWERSHKGSYHVYGHSHQGLPPLGQSFDIGVEGHDYSPWSLEEIWAKMETLEPHHIIAEEKKWPGKYTD
jgi:calcineurin-like phosphoesterase family protein